MTTKETQENIGIEGDHCLYIAQVHEHLPADEILSAWSLTDVEIACSSEVAASRDQEAYPEALQISTFLPELDLHCSGIVRRVGFTYEYCNDI